MTIAMAMYGMIGGRSSVSEPCLFGQGVRDGGCSRVLNLLDISAVRPRLSGVVEEACHGICAY